MVLSSSGYMPPEYVMHGQFSVKLDVFNFGVLILEIISGKKISSFNQSDGAEYLLSYAPDSIAGSSLQHLAPNPTPLKPPTELPLPTPPAALPPVSHPMVTRAKAGYPDTRRFTSGYSIYLGDNLVSWSAKKQPTVSCSSCEFEYRALALTAAELIGSHISFVTSKFPFHSRLFYYVTTKVRSF
ncbi:hypothetical protein F0562_014218 [Nyssa sinensis]|uniref:Serine-threonine/tyrosine-protein kinase catalytic domain-containing protein n=1 Tax=Nyssa sinensis TaxID=561372 RepID=A0A5J4ZRA0_9ASTE|nr:hypothetical protein F0562_014218 [Nyssa sinensis]